MRRVVRGILFCLLPLIFPFPCYGIALGDWEVVYEG